MAIKATIEMENGKKMTLELYPEYAPQTVENFVELANEHFYDGLIFHRVIKNFMIQGGDPLGTGFGGSDKKIKGEFAANGVNNPPAPRKRRDIHGEVSKPQLRIISVFHSPQGFAAS